ncbi:MAG TPA: 3-ketoacyl-ACP reductase FabG2 [Steroidobacteraceae bacterium]|nr:3-ketoacyl-ACP reductase FabG2 [Steroidobacteraceae bacterium]
MTESAKTDRSILVTGSSRGIGRAIAEKLASSGFQVVLHCRDNLAAAEQARAAIVNAGGLPPRILRFDIANRAGCAAEITADIAAHGAYFGVVCNAGVARDGAFPALTDEDWDTVLRTNLDGFYNVLHPAIMPMIRRRAPARIVTLASVSGVMGTRGQVNYSASKAGIIGATKALAVELASRGITVNCVAPGLIRTEMISDAPVEEALKMVPMGRVGEPGEVAGVINFLMSEEAAYITRQVIGVNGGMI